MNTRAITNSYRIKQWSDIVRQCRTSGQTISSWCEENGINEKSYYYWQKRVREATGKSILCTPEDTNPFVPIKISPFSSIETPSISSDQAITLTVNSIVISIHNSASSSVIENLLRAIQNAG